VSVPRGGAQARRAGHHNPFVVLVVVLSATFMQLVDVSIVNVAIPSIQRDLHASYGAVQLVLVLYQLGFACTLITGARLGDIYGRKRMFIIGMTGFTIASALCGAAPSAIVLTVGRLVQGVFSGLMFPQVLSVIQVIFPPKDRGRAFGIFGATIGIATILGPLLGGVLIAWNPAGLDWRTVFYVNLPIGIAALVGAWLLMGESTSPDAPRLDLGGVVLITAALLLLIYPIIEGRDRGWPWWIWVLLLGCIPFFVAFVIYERRRTARHQSPLIVMSLFSDRAFRIGLVLSFLFFAGIPAFFFTFSVFLQIGHGFTPLHSGLTSFPYSVGAVIASPLSDRLAQRYGKRILTAGLSILLAGYVGILLTIHEVGIHPHSYEFIPSMFICGIGFGLFVAPVVNIILAGIHAEGAGSASGTLSTAQQVGGALGVALIGVIMFGLLGLNANRTVDRVAPQLNRELVSAQLPAPAVTQIEQQFRACFDARAHAKDPSATPPECRPPKNSPLTADQASAVGRVVGAKGVVTQAAVARDFNRSYQVTLIWEFAVFGFAWVAVFLLPSPRRAALAGHGPPAEAATDGGADGVGATAEAVSAPVPPPVPGHNGSSSVQHALPSTPVSSNGRGGAAKVTVGIGLGLGLGVGLTWLSRRRSRRR
jgi:EmrB/QacA subfamily drug resistance transporter